MTGGKCVYIYIYMCIIMYVWYSVTGGVRFIMSRYTTTADRDHSGVVVAEVTCVRAAEGNGNTTLALVLFFFFENFPVFHKQHIHILLCIIYTRRTEGLGR